MKTFERANSFRKVPTSLLGIIIFCFFLPFINVSCSGQTILKMTGKQLITGTTIEKPTPFGEVKKEEIKSDKIIVVAFISVILAFISSFKSKYITTSFFSGAVIPLFIIFKIYTDNEAVKNGLTIEYLFPFWLVFILSLITSCTSLYFFSKKFTLTEEKK